MSEPPTLLKLVDMLHSMKATQLHGEWMSCLVTAGSSSQHVYTHMEVCFCVNLLAQLIPGKIERPEL